MPDRTETYQPGTDIFTEGSGAPPGGNTLAAPTRVEPVNQPNRPRFQAGERFGDYLILRELGRGGFATVYLAHEVTLDRRVALKVSEVRGLGEGQTLAELEHEHIVRVHAQFTEPTTNKHCLCLQYIPGTTLSNVISRLHRQSPAPLQGQDILNAIGIEFREEIPFDPVGLRNREILMHRGFTAAVCRIGMQLADALHFAHRRGVLHCDVKPANVLMNPYGKPHLLDFNVAVDVDAMRAGKSVGGTVLYMSPEQLTLMLKDGKPRIDERSDIYSLGLLLFEFLTGQHPMELKDDDGERELSRAQQTFGPHVSWARFRLPPVLERILRRCLDPLPENRYPDAGQLAQALANAFELLSIEKSLPKGGALTARALRRPIGMLIALTMLPQLAGSVVNIAYNSVEIKLTETAQREAFGKIVLLYNITVYPLALAIMLWLVIPLIRGWRGIESSGTMRGQDIDKLRSRSLYLGSWTIWLALAGWLPGGLIFPLAIDQLAGPIGWRIYAHFALSFTLSGLIALIYSHFGIQFIVLRVFYPQLGNADTHSRESVRAELDHATRWLPWFQGLATVVPLVGAILLLFAVTEMTLEFKLLVISLIFVGGVGVFIALAVNQYLNQVVRALKGEV